MRRRFQIGMGVNPSLIINKGIYIQHVDGGLYTKEFTYSWYYDINIQGDHLDTSTRSNPRYVRPFTELIL